MKTTASSMNNHDLLDGGYYNRCLGKMIIDKIVTLFLMHFKSVGYIEHEGVPISSCIDKSVRFIGSHISVLKRYLLTGHIPYPGYVMMQECIRTQSLAKRFQDDCIPKYGSFFPSLGVLTSGNRLTELGHETILFFTKNFFMPNSSIMLRVSSHDEDLLWLANSLASTGILIEVDSKSESYYRHVYGIPKVHGRNFNIAICNDSGEYVDVGNIIIIESRETILGIELALGATTIMKELLNLAHLGDCYPFSFSVATSIENQEGLIRKLEDAVMVCITLYREGVRPGSSNNQRRLLRSYVRLLLYTSHSLKLNMEDLQNILTNFENAYYLGVSGVVKEIIEYIRIYKRDLQQNNIQTTEDRVIANRINLI